MAWAQDAQAGAPPCSDAERRRALELAAALRGGGRETRVVPLWVRPSWWLVQALCAVAGVIAGVVGVSHPVFGVALAGVALVIAATDLSRWPLPRRLTPAQATQDVVSVAPQRAGTRAVMLILTAATDDPRGGLGARVPVRLPAVLPASLLLLGGALGLRIALTEPGGWLDVVQLLPTLALLALIPMLLHEGLGELAPDEGARETVLEVAAQLDSRPPRNLDVAVVFAGAGGALGCGLRAWLRDRRDRGLEPSAVAIVHVQPHAGDDLVWWERDGIVLGTRLHPQLIGAARRAAREHPGSHVVRSARPTAAAIARSDRWPAIAVGPDTEFTLALVRELDSELGAEQREPSTG